VGGSPKQLCRSEEGAEESADDADDPVTMKPPGSWPGMSALAMIPARRPRMMNAMIPMIRS
jgi:hypothetical protein